MHQAPPYRRDLALTIAAPIPGGVRDHRNGLTSSLVFARLGGRQPTVPDGVVETSRRCVVDAGVARRLCKQIGFFPIFEPGRLLWTRHKPPESGPWIGRYGKAAEGIAVLAICGTPDRCELASKATLCETVRRISKLPPQDSKLRPANSEGALGVFWLAVSHVWRITCIGHRERLTPLGPV